VRREARRAGQRAAALGGETARAARAQSLRSQPNVLPAVWSTASNPKTSCEAYLVIMVSRRLAATFFALSSRDSGGAACGAPACAAIMLTMPGGMPPTRLPIELTRRARSSTLSVSLEIEAPTLNSRLLIIAAMSAFDGSPIAPRALSLALGAPAKGPPGSAQVRKRLGP
jgi:hypothetical protein